MIAEFSQAGFDVLGQFVAKLSVATAELFFGGGVCFRSCTAGRSHLLAALNCLLQAFLEIRHCWSLLS